MAFIPVPDVAKSVFVYSAAQRRMTNVIHSKKDTPSPWSASDLATLNAQLGTWWAGNIQGLQSHDITLSQIISTALDTSTSPQAVESTSLVGGISVNSLPLGVAMCVSFYTDTRGRSFRGRFYLSGLDRNTSDPDGLWNTAAVASVVTGMRNLPTALSLMSFPAILGVVSYRHAGAPRTTGEFNEVTTITVRNTVPRYQRRREQDHHGRLR